MQMHCLLFQSTLDKPIPLDFFGQILVEFFLHQLSRSWFFTQLTFGNRVLRRFNQLRQIWRPSSANSARTFWKLCKIFTGELLILGI